MSTQVTVNQSKPVRIIGLVTAIVGVIMLVAGAVVYGMVSSMLKDERITVSADADFLPNKEVAGPFTAFAQAKIINHHALAAPAPETLDPAIADTAGFAAELGGKTYAELGDIGNKYKAQVTELTDGGATVDDPAVVEAQAKADAAAAKRATVMNGSFLRASLFTSVVSFGVATFVMAVGVLFAVIGWSVMKISGGPAVVTESGKKASA